MTTKGHTERQLERAHKLVAKSGAVLSTQLTLMHVSRTDTTAVITSLEDATKILKALIVPPKPGE